MGLLSSAYNAVDRYLPADSLLDPMLGGRQAAPQPHGGLLGGLMGGLGTVAHAADNVLGLGIGDAVHKQRQAERNAALKESVMPILTDASKQPADRIAAARQAIAQAEAQGADVTEWVAALDAAESRANLMGLFAPRDGATGVPGVATAAPILAREYFRNPEATKGIESILKDSQPDVMFDNGVGYNKNDASNIGKFHPSLEKGQEPLYDGQGNIVAIRNVDGSVQSAADMAGAVTGAQEGAKAALDLVDVPMPDGRTVKMTRAQAVQALSGGAGAPAVPGGFGVAPSPAEMAGAKKTAENQADRANDQPKAYAGLQSQALTTDTVLSAIDKALPMINRLTAGPLAGTSAIPGTPARDLQAVLDTIRANVGFSKLQEMRNNSPTGGALGQVSEQENRLLQSVMGSIDAGQSPAQLKANLQNIAQQLRTLKAQREQLYNQQYAQPAGPTMAGKGYKIISVQ